MTAAHLCVASLSSESVVCLCLSSPEVFSVLPWEQLSGYEGYTPADVCAGVQPFLQMVIAHTSQVFLMTHEDGLTYQVLS